MKISKAYYGTNTYGVSIESAVSTCGVWFFRSWEFNGYGKAWSKWEKSDELTFETEYTNRYNGEICQYTKPQAFGGFSKMEEYDITPRYRLPKSA